MNVGTNRYIETLVNKSNEKVVLESVVCYFDVTSYLFAHYLSCTHNSYKKQLKVLKR